MYEPIFFNENINKYGFDKLTGWKVLIYELDKNKLKGNMASLTVLTICVPVQ